MTTTDLPAGSRTHGFQSVGVGGVWNVWAPRAAHLDLVLLHGPANEEIVRTDQVGAGQFPGSRGWRYDGTYWFAAQSSYGGPDGLMRLVTACHRIGLGIFLDVIYNHLGPEGNYLGEFSPYFTDRYSTPWGWAVTFDGDGCAGARSLVLDNVRHWFRDFGFDGLRLDAVHAIFDNRPIHILAVIQRVANEEGSHLGRRIQVIAESDLNDTVILAPTEVGPDDGPQQLPLPRIQQAYARRPESGAHRTGRVTILVHRHRFGLELLRVPPTSPTNPLKRLFLPTHRSRLWLPP